MVQGSIVVMILNLWQQFYMRVDHRVRSSHNLRDIKRLPSNNEEIEKKRDSLRKYSKNYKFDEILRQESELSHHKRMQETQHTFHRHFQGRIGSSITHKTQLRPFSHVHSQIPSNQSDAPKTPLQVLKSRQQIRRTMSTISNPKIVPRAPLFQKRVASSFLRKGSSINKSIMETVLKNKCSQKVTPSQYNYSNARSQKRLIDIIKSQIPYGMSDILGAEEMLRMSHIYTGTKLDTVDLHKRVEVELTVRHADKQKGPGEDQQEILKSIKRW